MRLKHSVLVEVHQAPTEVPVEAQCEDVEHGQDCEGGQEVVGPREDVKGAVAQESDVYVVAESHQPQGIAKHGGDEPVTF